MRLRQFLSLVDDENNGLLLFHAFLEKILFHGLAVIESGAKKRADPKQLRQMHQKLISRLKDGIQDKVKNEVSLAVKRLEECPRKGGLACSHISQDQTQAAP